MPIGRSQLSRKVWMEPVVKARAQTSTVRLLVTIVERSWETIQHFGTRAVCYYLPCLPESRKLPQRDPSACSSSVSCNRVAKGYVPKAQITQCPNLNCSQRACPLATASFLTKSPHRVELHSVLGRVIYVTSKRQPFPEAAETPQLPSFVQEGDRPIPEHAWDTNGSARGKPCTWTAIATQPCTETIRIASGPGHGTQWVALREAWLVLLQEPDLIVLCTDS